MKAKAKAIAVVAILFLVYACNTENMKSDHGNIIIKDKNGNTNGAIQVKNKDEKTTLAFSENVPHIFEIYKKSNPYLSIHDGSTATFKIGVHETNDSVGLFRIVQMNNGGNPDVAKAGISMTMNHQVGIGTDNPQTRLHINGDLRVDGNIFILTKHDSIANLTNLIHGLYQEIEKLNNKVEELEKKLSK